MAGVYISWPFCAQKCTYCNFASGVFQADLEAEYLKAVVREIEGHEWEWRPETLYLGGGTPSRLGADELGKLLEALPVSRWAEATIEASPGGITEEQARQWGEAGINRVSLGVQSFVGGELRRTGRRHTAATVEAEVAALRKSGINNINIDLIAGLPGQTAESWEESLQWIERLAPPHVCVYMLEVDEDSRLGLEILEGGARYGAGEVPSEEWIAEFYERAVDFLADRGIHRYEISNFAREGWESLHNLKYWKLEPYVGFGADAHSFDGRFRRRNAERVQDYVALMRRGGSACVWKEAARPEEERFFVGLRLTQGIQPAPEDWQRYAAPIERLMREGLLARDKQRLRLTRRGVMLSNEVLQEFIAA
jgi:oxygen-independent coproporphyrinogen-3 oxidase